MRNYPKLRRPYPKLWRQLLIGAQKFRVGAHKFRVCYLIFDSFENKYVYFSSKSDKTNCIVNTMAMLFD